MKKCFFRSTLIILSLLVFGLYLPACSQKSPSRIEQEFNKQNQVVKETTYIRGQLFGTTTYQYDPNGNKSRETHFDEKGLQTYYITFEYNSKNQMIKKTQYQDGKMFTETTISYNDNGLMIRSDNLTHQGGKSYNLYFYDENDNMIEHKQFAAYSDGDVLRFWSKYTYTPSGNIEQETKYDKNENITSVTKYKYNKKGDLKKITEYDSDGNVISSQDY